MSLLGVKWSGTRAIFVGSNTLVKPAFSNSSMASGRGDVVGQRQVDLGLDDVAGAHLVAPAGARQDLLYDRVSHQLVPFAAATLFKARTYAFAEASITSNATAWPWYECPSTSTVMRTSARESLPAVTDRT